VVLAIVAPRTAMRPRPVRLPMSSVMPSIDRRASTVPFELSRAGAWGRARGIDERVELRVGEAHVGGEAVRRGVEPCVAREPSARDRAVELPHHDGAAVGREFDRRAAVAHLAVEDAQLRGIPWSR
jgi:hypothetical protein